MEEVGPLVEAAEEEGELEGESHLLLVSLQVASVAGGALISALEGETEEEEEAGLATVLRHLGLLGTVGSLSWEGWKHVMVLLLVILAMVLMLAILAMVLMLVILAMAEEVMLLALAVETTDGSGPVGTLQYKAFSKMINDYYLQVQSLISINGYIRNGILEILPDKLWGPGGP